MTRLLVVAPRFHGYGEAIGRAFERLGYEVLVHRYDSTAGTLRKAWNKGRHELPSRLRGHGHHESVARASQTAVRVVREVRPQRLLVIRGDALTEDFWQAAAASGPVVAWLYDELRRTTFVPELVARYARLATYSPLDAAHLRAQGHEAAHVPLGYDDSRGPASVPAARGVVSFIGAYSPHRAEALGALARAGVPVHAWGRTWSDHAWDRARTWRLASRGLPASRDVASAEALGVMRDSAATLNVHGDQDGFTMRTFEAAGAGGVQLVDREDVAGLYEPDREVLVFRDHDELVEHARRAVRSPSDLSHLRERAARRTLAEHTLVHRARLLEDLW